MSELPIECRNHLARIAEIKANHALIVAALEVCAKMLPPSPVNTAQPMFADTHAASGKTKKGGGG